ncbi:hypothetical protein SuUB63_21850 [Streptococcus uberis]
MTLFQIYFPAFLLSGDQGRAVDAPDMPLCWFGGSVGVTIRVLFRLSIKTIGLGTLCAEIREGPVSVGTLFVSLKGTIAT